MTTDEMSRDEAISIVDRVTSQFAETIRVGRCVSCEALWEGREIDRSELPPEREAIVQRTEELLEQKAGAPVKWQIAHSLGCTWFWYWERLPEFCRRMNIDVGMFEVAIRKGEGAWTVSIPIRRPSLGDPEPFVTS